MWQLINHSVNDKSDTTKWTLLYSNVTEADILLRKEWDALAAANPDRLKLVYTLDKPPAGWKGAEGYITPELIKKHVHAEGDKLKFFVCGPPPQVKAIAGEYLENPAPNRVQYGELRESRDQLAKEELGSGSKRWPSSNWQSSRNVADHRPPPPLPPLLLAQVTRTEESRDPLEERSRIWGLRPDKFSSSRSFRPT